MFAGKARIGGPSCLIHSSIVLLCGIGMLLEMRDVLAQDKIFLRRKTDSQLISVLPGSIGISVRDP